MNVVDDPGALRAFLDRERSRGKTVGFFPARGGLHGGHRANIFKMAAECDVATVGIFASRAQPGRSEGLFSRPANIAVDLAQAEDAGATAAFVPSGEAMFATGRATSLPVGRPCEVLESSDRPSPFGARAVAKLLSLVGPCYAYFGEKDYQQLVLVHRVVKGLRLPAAVVACPTVREPDGLALSTRNFRLSPPERDAAPALYWALLAGKRAVDEGGETDANVVRATMKEVASRPGTVELDYAEVAHPETLEPVEEISGEVRLLVAGRIGRTRLIDNVAARTREA
jgi:pantoate--beta-alanine ligase